MTQAIRSSPGHGCAGVCGCGGGAWAARPLSARRASCSLDAASARFPGPGGAGSESTGPATPTSAAGRTFTDCRHLGSWRRPGAASTLHVSRRRSGASGVAGSTAYVAADFCGPAAFVDVSNPAASVAARVVQGAWTGQERRRRRHQGRARRSLFGARPRRRLESVEAGLARFILSRRLRARCGDVRLPGVRGGQPRRFLHSRSLEARCPRHPGELGAIDQGDRDARADRGVRAVGAGEAGLDRGGRFSACVRCHQPCGADHLRVTPNERSSGRGARGHNRLRRRRPRRSSGAGPLNAVEADGYRRYETATQARDVVVADRLVFVVTGIGRDGTEVVILRRN